MSKVDKGKKDGRAKPPSHKASKANRSSETSYDIVTCLSAASSSFKPKYRRGSIQQTLGEERFDNLPTEARLRANLGDPKRGASGVLIEGQVQVLIWFGGAVSDFTAHMQVYASAVKMFMWPAHEHRSAFDEQ